ncbi:MAG: hypothetical protein C0485_13800 [Pirellula sp.]|nr:hypothetical protein [Pirellula sp.]
MSWREVSEGGGAKLSYGITGQDLHDPAEIKFLWGATADATTGVPATTASYHTAITQGGHEVTISGSEFIAPPSFDSYLIVIADPTNTVRESSEVNNSGSALAHFGAKVELSIEADGPNFSVRDAVKNQPYQVVAIVQNLSPTPLPAFAAQWLEIRLEGVREDLPPSSTAHFGNFSVPVIGFDSESSVVVADFRHNWEWIPSDNPVLGSVTEAPSLSDFVANGWSYVEELIHELTNGRLVNAKLLGTVYGVIDSVAEAFFTTELTNVYRYTVTPLNADGLLLVSTPHELTIGVPPARLAAYTAYNMVAATGVATLMTGLKELAFAAAFGGSLRVELAGVAAGTLLLGATQMVAAGGYYEFAKDPPDAEFNIPVVVEPIDFNSSEVASSFVTRQMVEIGLEIAALKGAELKALNKADGAELAGDTYWRARQLDDAGKFAIRAAELEGRLISYEGLLSELTAVLPAQEPFDAADYLAENGLPESTESLLLESGWTQSQIDHLVSELIACSSLPELSNAVQLDRHRTGLTMGSSLGLEHLRLAAALRSDVLQVPTREFTIEETQFLEMAEDAIELGIQADAPTTALLKLIESYQAEVLRLLAETNSVEAVEKVETALTFSARFHLLAPTLSGLEASIASHLTEDEISSVSATQLLSSIAFIRIELQAGEFSEATRLLSKLHTQVVTDGEIPPSVANSIGGYASYIASAAARGATTNGDFDLDGDADGTDFLVWQRRFGSSVESFTYADGSGNGIVDEADLGIWEDFFGAIPTSSAVMDSSMSNYTDLAAVDAVDAANLEVFSKNDYLSAAAFKKDVELAAYAEVTNSTRKAHDAIFASGDFTSLFSSEASTIKTKRHPRVRHCV